MRLDRLVRADDPPFTAAAAMSQDEFHSAKVTILEAQTRPRRLADRPGRVGQGRTSAGLSFGVSQNRVGPADRGLFAPR